MRITIVETTVTEEQSSTLYLSQVSFICMALSPLRKLLRQYKLTSIQTLKIMHQKESKGIPLHQNRLPLMQMMILDLMKLRLSLRTQKTLIL